MPIRGAIAPNNIYHVLNRGVDKRKVFLDEEDYLRFIHDLFEFNDVNPTNNLTYRFNLKPKELDPYLREAEKKKPRKLLVDVLAFCLMPNHYHLLLKPYSSESLILFMRKLNVGYAMYFNQKHKRTGVLFEGRYKMVPVSRDAHFIHLPYYIHFNPLDLLSKQWRQKELKDYARAIKFLEAYRWSSHLDYLGIKNFPSVTQRKLLLEFFGSENGYRKSVKNWLKEIDTESIGNLSLESKD